MQISSDFLGNPILRILAMYEAKNYEGHSCQELDLLARSSTSYDARHEKTDLKVFVVVISKEGWARVAVPILLLA